MEIKELPRSFKLIITDDERLELANALRALNKPSHLYSVLMGV